MTYVTDESGTVGLTAYVDDEHAHDDERPALLVFMPCEGRCITQSFPAWQGRDAYGAAGPFAVRCGIRAKLYYLAIIPAARGSIIISASACLRTQWCFRQPSWPSF